MGIHGLTSFCYENIKKTSTEVDLAKVASEGDGITLLLDLNAFIMSVLPQVEARAQLSQYSHLVGGEYCVYDQFLSEMITSLEEKGISLVCYLDPQVDNKRVRMRKHHTSEERTRQRLDSVTAIEEACLDNSPVIVRPESKVEVVSPPPSTQAPKFAGTVITPAMLEDQEANIASLVIAPPVEKESLVDLDREPDNRLQYDQSGWLKPPLVNQQVTQSLRALGVDVRVCSKEEADVEMVWEFREKSAEFPSTPFACLSQDSDFFVLSGSRYIPLDQIDLLNTSCEHLHARLFSPEKVASALRLKNHQTSLFDLAILCGNDATSHFIHKHSIPSRLQMPHVTAIRPNSAHSPHEETVRGLVFPTDAASWLNSLSSSKKAKRSALMTHPIFQQILAQDPEFKSAVHQSYEFYKADLTGVDAADTDDDDKKGTSVQLVVSSLSKGLLPTSVLSVAKNAQFTEYVDAEARSQWSSTINSSLLPLRRVMYALLGRKSVEELGRSYSHISSTVVPSAPSIPFITVAWQLPQDKRKKLLEQAVLSGRAENTCGKVSPGFWLTTLTLQFLETTANLQRFETLAIVAMLVVLNKCFKPGGRGGCNQLRSNLKVCRMISGTSGLTTPSFRCITVANQFQVALASVITLARLLMLPCEYFVEPSRIMSGTLFQTLYVLFERLNSSEIPTDQWHLTWDLGLVIPADVYTSLVKPLTPPKEFAMKNGAQTTKSSPQRALVSAIPSFYDPKAAANEYRRSERQDYNQPSQQRIPPTPVTPPLPSVYAPSSHSNTTEEIKPSHAAASILSPPKASPLANNNTNLPVSTHRNEIVDHINANPLTCIQGETGCGKSSMVPHFILSDCCGCKGSQCDAKQPTENKPKQPTGKPGRRRRQKKRVDRRDLNCPNIRIVVTQPRRIAATSLAKRVAEQRGEELGDTVGYRISRESVSKSSSRLIYVTTGYLLQMLGAETNNFWRFTHIVLDEVHERDVDSDLLSLIVKMLFHKAPKVKLIIMSATLQANLFAQYFAKQNYPIPKPIFVGVQRYPVEVIYVEDFKRLGLPEKVLQLSNKVQRTFDTTLDSGRASNQLAAKLSANDAALTVSLIEAVSQPGRCTLVFLPGMSDISHMSDSLEGLNSTKLDIVVLHSLSPREEQDRAMLPAETNSSKVILATNIAESSLTIPDVHCIIDMGRQKEMIWDSKLGMDRLAITWASRASATQRAGRAGRLAPGTCLRLFTREFFEKVMSDYDQPEIGRSSLETPVLKMKMMMGSLGGVTDLMQQLLTPPEETRVECAFNRLLSMGAITSASEDGMVASLGKLSVQLPISVQLTKLILMGVLVNRVPDVIVMAASLSEQEIFTMPHHLFENSVSDYSTKLMQSFRGRKFFMNSTASEPVALLNAFLGWAFAKSRPKWSAANGVNFMRCSILNRLIGEIAYRTRDFLLRDECFQHHPYVQAILKDLQVLTDSSKLSTYKGWPDSVREIFGSDLLPLQVALTASFADLLVHGTSRPAQAFSNNCKSLNLDPMRVIELPKVQKHLLSQEASGLRQALEIVGKAAKVVTAKKGSKVYCEFADDDDIDEEEEDTTTAFVGGEKVMMDVCDATQKLLQLTSGRLHGAAKLPFQRKIVEGQDYVGDKSAPAPSDSITLKFQSIPAVSWRLSASSLVVKPNWRSPLGFAVDMRQHPFVPKEQRVTEMWGVLASIVGSGTMTETTGVRGCGLTVLPPNLAPLLVLIFSPLREGSGRMKVLAQFLSETSEWRIFGAQCRGRLVGFQGHYITQQDLLDINDMRQRVGELLLPPPGFALSTRARSLGDLKQDGAGVIARLGALSARVGEQKMSDTKKCRWIEVASNSDEGMEDPEMEDDDFSQSYLGKIELPERHMFFSDSDSSSTSGEEDGYETDSDDETNSDDDR